MTMPHREPLRQEHDRGRQRISAASVTVAIVGGGIVGAACAAELALGGAAVTLIEQRRSIGIGGATAAGMGHVVVMDDCEAQFALTQHSQQLWRRLADQLPGDCEYRESGTLWIAEDDEQLAAVQAKHAYYTERGVPAEILDAEQLAEAEPQLRRGLAGALRVPEDGVLYPPCAADWLRRRAVDAGAQILTGTPVTRLGGRRVELADGRRVEADFTVNALGADAPRLTPGLDIRPRKGHLVITDRYPGWVQHQLVELGYLTSAHTLGGDSVAFNVQPRVTGQLLIGSSRQFDDPATEVDMQLLRRMLQRACMFLPGLPTLSMLRCWTGFRAATPDKLPLIGPWPEQPGLLIASGHEGLGITTSLATAQLIADHVLKRPSAIPAAPYLPARQTQVTHVR